MKDNFIKIFAAIWLHNLFNIPLRVFNRERSTLGVCIKADCNAFQVNTSVECILYLKDYYYKRKFEQKNRNMIVSLHRNIVFRLTAASPGQAKSPELIEFTSCKTLFYYWPNSR